MQRTLLSNVILLLILLSGCNTTYHYTEFLKPSNRYISSAIYRVGVVQRATNAQDVCPVYTDGIPYGELKNVPKRAANLTIENLKKLCEDIGRYQFVVIPYEDSLVSKENFATPPLTEEEILRLAGENDLDALISLDGHDMLIRTSGSVSVVTVNDETGMPAQVPEFSKQSEVNMSLLWRFYDCITGQKIDQYQESYERFFGRVSLSEEEIQTFKEEDMGLMDVAGMAAFDYYERIAPHWEPDYRQFFNAGSEDLVLIADKLELNGNWEEAAQEWRKLTKSENAKEKHKACFNMALASEILGQPRVAKEWIVKAKMIDPSRKTLKYEEIIDKQILIYEVVNSQLGID
jgi:hypothetical protein